MFGSNDNNKRSVSAPAGKEERNGIFLVCEQSFISGKVSTAENTVINGTIEGTLNVENNVAVGAKGVVRGPVYAHSLTLDGEVVGDVICKGPVRLSASARLTGDVQCTALIVMEGAYFCGKVVCDKPAAPEPEAVPQAEPEQQA